MLAAQFVTRIPYDELPPTLRELLAPRVERLGYLGEFFQCAAHQPDALAHFIRFTEALKDALPVRLVEAIALTVAARMENLYEQVQHERLALVSGFSEREVASLVAGRATECQTFSKAELAAVELASCVVCQHGVACEVKLARLRELVGEEAAVGCLMTAARYVAHAVMANAWSLRPPVSSPLERGIIG